MPPAPVELRRHFLPWEKPWLPQVVAWLADGWEGGPMDLSRVLAVVPTRQAGRRLRAALANHAAKQGAAVFAPRVLTPDTLAGLDLGPGVASRLESLLAWTKIFRELDLADFRQVFPVDPPVRNFPWALRLAQEFMGLQATLAEARLRLSDVPVAAGPDFIEAERWQQIAALAELHDSTLAEAGGREPQRARIEAATDGGGMLRYDRVVVLGVPDLPPLALGRLSAATATGTVDVVIFAPESEAANFEGCGRPIPAAWENREMLLPEFEQRTHLAADPAGQANLVGELASQYARAAGLLAVGVADPEITALIARELRHRDQPAYDPQGSSMRQEGLYELLAKLAALARDPSFMAVEALARCPDFFTYLAKVIGREFSVTGWLKGLDDLRANHLPADLATARELASVRPKYALIAQGLTAMDRIRETMTEDDFAPGTSAALREIFAARQLDLSRDADRDWQECAVAWTRIVQDCATAEDRFGPLPLADWWDLALRLFGEITVRAGDKPAGAIELQGWLELLWEDAPHLAVAGFNEGRVPEPVPEDAFLPASLRHRLGLETAATRYARDAYILQAIAMCRRSAGRLDLFFGKTSAVGDPLKPSRLLLRCPDSALPARIAFLFREPESPQSAPAWTRLWQLTPRAAPPPERVAVTALRRYLSCPFRFYLRNVLRMERVEPLKSELDAFDFGTLCHAALEQIGLDPGLRDCTDAGVLRQEVVDRLNRTVRERYGKQLSLPLIVQVESARQRVGKLAELQAAERAAGWEILQVERPFEINLSGLVVRGKIDRIDRHAGTGAVRVLDYKTSDKPVNPFDAHLRRLRPGEQLRAWAQFDFEGQTRTWMDLQLPLYMRALGGEHPGRLTCGYFNLPKAAGETTLALWEDYTVELHEAAMRCAEGACAAIRAGEFWPPNETIDETRDECAALFHHGGAESVEWAR